MNVSKRIGVSFFLLAPITMFLIWYMVHYLGQVSQAEVVQIVTEVTTEKQQVEDILFDGSLQKCMRSNNEEYISLAECKDKILLQNINEKSKNNDQKSIEDESLEGTFIINIIYIIMWLTLNLQLSVFVGTFDESSIKSCFFYISEWVTNSPPMLGVLGTILSFALLVSRKSEGLNDLFDKYFMEAAITTIIGGVVYIINLFLSINILSKVNENLRCK